MTWHASVICCTLVFLFCEAKLKRVVVIVQMRQRLVVCGHDVACLRHEWLLSIICRIVDLLFQHSLFNLKSLKLIGNGAMKRVENICFAFEFLQNLCWMCAHCSLSGCNSESAHFLRFQLNYVLFLKTTTPQSKMCVTRTFVGSKLGACCSKIGHCIPTSFSFSHVPRCLQASVSAAGSRSGLKPLSHSRGFFVRSKSLASALAVALALCDAFRAFSQRYLTAGTQRQVYTLTK